jgi:hypothetical protein
MQSSPASNHFLLGPYVLLSILFSNTLSLFFPYYKRSSFTPISAILNKIMSVEFNKIHYHNISWKYIQPVSNFFMCSDE